MMVTIKEYLPPVSIVVPVLNAEETIETLLESLLKVDYDRDNVDVVVVDGNSKDRTREIIAKYPVKLLVEEKEGLNAARNTGVKNSGNEIIIFTDADCVVPSDWIQKIVKNFNDPRVGCVGGNVKGCDGGFFSQYADNSIMPVLRSFKRHETLDMIKFIARYPAGCNMALRRRAIEEVGGFDEGIRYSFDEDELVERVCRAGYRMVLDSSVLILHKHRSTLKGLLEQTFRYGRGSGFLLKRKRAKDALSTWFLLNLLGFIAWLSIIWSLTFLTVTTTLTTSFLLLFGILFIPLLALMAFYAYKASENKRYERIILYPFIDMLRMLTFCVGELYQFIKPEKKA